MATKLVKSIVFLAGIFLCKIGYSQEMPIVHTHLVNHIQRVAILSKDTVYRGFVEISHNGTFYIADVDVDSISLEPTIEYRTHGRQRSMFKKFRRTAYREIRHKTTILSEQVDTITNLFAVENDDKSIVKNDDGVPIAFNVFGAKIETSYLLHILEKNGLVVQSDSLWIMIFPEYVYEPSSQYYIYQYCAHTQKLHLSVISFAQGFIPQVIFSSTARLDRKDMQKLNENLVEFGNVRNQKNCLNSSSHAAFVHRFHGKHTGVFRSYLCEDNPFFNLEFVFIGVKYFEKAPKIFGNEK